MFCWKMFFDCRRKMNYKKLDMNCCKMLKHPKSLSLLRQFFEKSKTNVIQVCSLITVLVLCSPIEYFSHSRNTNISKRTRFPSRTFTSNTNIFSNVLHIPSLSLQIATDTGLNERARYEQRIEDLEIDLRKVQIVPSSSETHFISF